ncbi:MAG: hypothetical protein K1Y36_28700 [Blastocatellia bacterium]|nr:hypothetical protein [Blastocatellia bacterium]
MVAFGRKPSVKDQLAQKKAELRSLQMAVPFTAEVCGLVEPASFGKNSDVGFLLFQRDRNRQVESQELLVTSLDQSGVLLALAATFQSVHNGFSISEYVLQCVREEWVGLEQKLPLHSALQKLGQNVNERLWLARQHTPSLRTHPVSLLLLAGRGQQMACLSFGELSLFLYREKNWQEPEIRGAEAVTAPVGLEKQAQLRVVGMDLEPGDIWVVLAVKQAVLPVWELPETKPDRICRFLVEALHVQPNRGRLALGVFSIRNHGEGKVDSNQGKIPTMNFELESTFPETDSPRISFMFKRFPTSLIVFYVGFIIVAVCFLLLLSLKSGH